MKKISKTGCVISLALAMLFSNVPIGMLDLVFDAWKDGNVVDVMWQATQSGSVIDSFGPSKASAATPITFVSAGVKGNGTANVTPGLPSGWAENDIFLLHIEGEGEDANADPQPSGWGTLIDTVASGTNGATDRTRQTIYWRRATASESAPTVPDAGNHTLAVITAWRGVTTSGNPIHNYQTSSSGTNDTSVSITGFNTSVDNAMIVASTSAGDDNGSGNSVISTNWVNANLASPGIAQAASVGTISGSDSSISVAYGGLTNQGATGITTVSAGASEEEANFTIALNPAPEVPGIAGSLGKTADGWSGAVPVYGTLTGGLSENDYPYARAQVTTIASQTFYADMAWDAGDSRFEGVVYPGSNICMGCDDPKTYNGSFSVVVQMDNNSGFPSVDYSGSPVTFTTAITLKRSSMNNLTDTNYTDFNAIWSTDHWNISINDFGFVMNAGTGTNIAVAVPIYPDTSSPSNFTVAYNGSSISQGSAASTTNAWWYNSASHTLYLQFASLTTTLVDVDITFQSDTDLFATRYNWTYTADMGSRKFSNGLYVANRYLTTFYYGKPFSTADNNVACSGNECEGTGMQAESRAHEDGGLDESTDCMERVAVHVDGTPRSDGTTYYQYDTKWKQSEWADWITSQSNSQFVIVTNSDDTASTGWAQQLNNGIAIKRTQTYYSGKRYIKNFYELTNSDSVSHNYPLVWEREQWHGADRAVNDAGRFQGNAADVNMEQRMSMSGYSCPWQTVYDKGTFINMGIIYNKFNLPDYGIFAVEPFLAPTAAEWPISISSGHATQTADQTGFEKTFASVAPSETVDLTFWHVHNAESSWANIASAMDADCAEVNPAAVSILIGDGDIAYGMVQNSADTTISGLDDTQTAINNGSVAEDFEIMGQNSADWALGATAGDAIYKHEWCVTDCDSSPVWNALTTAYQTLVTNIAATSYQDVDFRVTVPTANQGTTQQEVNIFIRATEH